MDEFVILKCINALNKLFNEKYEGVRAKEYIMFDLSDVIGIANGISNNPVLLISLDENSEVVVLTNEFASTEFIHEVSQIIRGVISNESRTKGRDWAYHLEN